MAAYILRRLALFVPTLIGVSMVVFVLVRLLPGDATTLLLQDAKTTAADEAALRHQLGLDKPIVLQYVDWVATLAHGDLGRSFKSRNPVADELSGRIPVTLELGLMAMVIAAAIAIPIGVLSAARQDTWADYLARSTALGLLAIPGFWLGTLVVTLPSVWWQWTPPLRYTRLFDDPMKNLAQVIIPAIILGLRLSGGLMRLSRTQVLQVLCHDFVRTAAAKGLAEHSTGGRPPPKKPFIPAPTPLGLPVPLLIPWTALLETLFGVP